MSGIWHMLWWYPQRLGYVIRPYDVLADRRRWFWQPRTLCGWSGVKVEIECPHGKFIPGVHRSGRPSSRYACPKCAIEIRISDHVGEVTW